MTCSLLRGCDGGWGGTGGGREIVGGEYLTVKIWYLLWDGWVVGQVGGFDAGKGGLQ